MTTPIGKLRTHKLYKLENGYPVVRLETGEYKQILVEDSIITASYSPTSLPLTGGTITGNLTVLGTASVATLYTIYETSSVLHMSGSTKFGNSADDTHEITGSVTIKGSINTPAYSIGNISGSVTLSPTMSLQIANLVADSRIEQVDGGNIGDKLETWLTPSGSNYTLDFNTSSIIVPSDSALGLPKTLTADKTYIVLFKRNNNNWMLASLVGGY